MRLIASSIRRLLFAILDFSKSKSSARASSDGTVPEYEIIKLVAVLRTGGSQARHPPLFFARSMMMMMIGSRSDFDFADFGSISMRSESNQSSSRRSMRTPAYEI